MTVRLFFPSVPLIFFVPAVFLPGLRSTVPTSFSAAPSTLSLIDGLRLWCVAGARFWTPAPVFLVMVRLRDGEVEIDCKMRGLELPVAERVEGMAEGVNLDEVSK